MRGATLATVVSLAALAGPARADGVLDALAGQGAGSIDVERLRPGLDEGAVLDVESGALPAAGAVDAALVVNGALDPLTVSFSPEGGRARTTALVDDRVSAHVLASWAPVDGVSLGAELPVVVFQSGPLVVPGVAGKDPIAPFGLDDVRLVPKLALVRSSSFDLAAAAHVTLPTSVPRHRYIGDGLPTLTPELDASLRFGALRVAADAGFLARWPSVFGDVVQGDEIALRAGAAWGFGPVELAATVNQALVVYPTPLAAGDNPGEALVGVTAHLGALDVFVAAGTTLVGAPGTPLARALAGVRFVPGRSPPAPRAEAVAAPADRDGDGLLDAADRCPAAAGPAALRGCPDGDHDGVADVDDRCADSPGRVDGGGCPYSVAEDRDQDGIADADDACPDVAEDKDGVVDGDGCPGDDEDEDGLADAADRCPSAPETYNGVDDDDGCPDDGGVAASLAGGRVDVAAPIAFAGRRRGRPVLDDEAARALDAVASLLRAHREIKKVRVEAHTEPSRARRMQLLLASQARAAAVKRYLVAHGVDEARIEAVGYGGSRPLVHGVDAKSRDKNRRVELVVLERG